MKKIRTLTLLLLASYSCFSQSLLKINRDGNFEEKNKKALQERILINLQKDQFCVSTIDQNAHIITQQDISTDGIEIALNTLNEIISTSGNYFNNVEPCSVPRVIDYTISQPPGVSNLTLDNILHLIDPDPRNNSSDEITIWSRSEAENTASNIIIGIVPGQKNMIDYTDYCDSLGQFMTFAVSLPSIISPSDTASWIQLGIDMSTAWNRTSRGNDENPSMLSCNNFFEAYKNNDTMSVSASCTTIEGVELFADASIDEFFAVKKAYFTSKNSSANFLSFEQRKWREILLFLAYYQDLDGDGYGDPDIFDSSCDGPPSGFVSNDTDCDDTNPEIYLDAPEIPDGLDNDCDGLVDQDDPDFINQMTYYLDFDGDLYGDSLTSILDTIQPNGYVLDNTDCNDLDSDINPGATDIPDNGIDENCDGMDEMISSISEQDTEKIYIYPNPVSIDTRLSVDLAENSQVEVFDQMGKLLIMSQSASRHRIDVSALETGVYILSTNHKMYKIFVE